MGAVVMAAGGGVVEDMAVVVAVVGDRSGVVVAKALGLAVKKAFTILIAEAVAAFRYVRSVYMVRSERAMC